LLERFTRGLYLLVHDHEKQPHGEQARRRKVLIDQIRTIDTTYVAGELVDYLSRDDMAQVEHGLSRYLGLLC